MNDCLCVYIYVVRLCIIVLVFGVLCVEWLLIVVFVFI